MLVIFTVYRYSVYVSSDVYPSLDSVDLVNSQETSAPEPGPFSFGWSPSTIAISGFIRDPEKDPDSHPD